ncbi:MAG TPA: hypothetical protein VGC40_09105 [Paenirhodobacter sp.]
MNLSALSLKEAVELQGVLEIVIGAASRLAELPERGEGELTIDLTPGGAIILVAHYDMPPAIKIVGDELVLIDASMEADQDESAAPHHTVAYPDSTGEQDHIAEAGTMIAPAAAPPAADPAATTRSVVVGPLTDDEKSTVRDLAEKGATASTIAGLLNRRTQTIALFMAQGRKASPSSVAAAKAKIKDAAPVLPPKDVPPVTSPESAVPVSVNAVVHDGLTGENLRIWTYLDELGPAPGFDAEMDYDLVDILSQGAKLGQAALDLDVDSARLRDRYAALCKCVLDGFGKVPDANMARLHAVLAARAIRARKAAK